jgi:hypothetical protein
VWPAAAANLTAGADEAIRPFREHIPQAQLDDLRKRAATLAQPGTRRGRSRGVQLKTLQALARY